MDRIVSERICNPSKQHGLDTKRPQKVSEDSWGSRGRRFKSCHSDHVRTHILIQWVLRYVSLLFCPKAPKTAEFITLLRKAPPPSRQINGLKVVLFAFLGPLVGQAIVRLWYLPSNSEGERPGLTKAIVKLWGYRTFV